IKRKMGQRTTVALGPHALTPEEVSSKILAELKERMREMLTQKPAKPAGSREDLALPVTRAVITVPAYFDAPQVEATRRAAAPSAGSPGGPPRRRSLTPGGVVGATETSSSTPGGAAPSTCRSCAAWEVSTKPSRGRATTPAGGMFSTAATPSTCGKSSSKRG